MKSNAKTILITVISTITFLTASYFAYIGYLVTNGYRDYQEFCEKYIPQIEKYKLANERYPKSLDVLAKPNFSFRYDNKGCAYQAKKDGYVFAIRYGLLGIAFYNSGSRVWMRD